MATVDVGSGFAEVSPEAAVAVDPAKLRVGVAARGRRRGRWPCGRRRARLDPDGTVELPQATFSLEG